MGATWFGNNIPPCFIPRQTRNIHFKQHTKGISIWNHVFVPPQKFEIPDAEEPSYRIQGGTQTLINRLVAEIGVENITKRKVKKSLKKYTTS
jgi:monoamine oxidase